MTGPSPWLLPSPRGGLTSVTVSGSTIELVGSIIELPVPEWEHTAPGRKVKEGPTPGRSDNEPHSRRRGGPARRLARARVPRPYRERSGPHPLRRRHGAAGAARARGRAPVSVLTEGRRASLEVPLVEQQVQIGRASCRERV